MRSHRAVGPDCSCVENLSRGLGETGDITHDETFVLNSSLKSQRESLHWCGQVAEAPWRRISIKEHAGLTYQGVGSRRTEAVAIRGPIADTAGRGSAPERRFGCLATNAQEPAA